MKLMKIISVTLVILLVGAFVFAVSACGDVDSDIDDAQEEVADALGDFSDFMEAGKNEVDSRG